MLSFMNAQYSLFQQGYNLLDEIDPYMKKLAAEVRGVIVLTTTRFLRHPGLIGPHFNYWYQPVT